MAIYGGPACECDKSIFDPFWDGLDGGHNGDWKSSRSSVPENKHSNSPVSGLLAVSEAATQCEIRSYDSYRWKHVLSVCLATYAVFNPNEDNAEISIIVRHRIETGTYHCRKVTKKRNQPNRASQHSVCFGVCRGEEDATSEI